MKTAEEILKEKGNPPMIGVKPDTTVAEALKVMVEKKIGAILIQDDDDILGIYTERDLLNNIVERIDPNITMIKHVMQTQLCTASHDMPIYRLQDQMLGTRCRHLLIAKDNQFIGLLSAGDVTKASLNEKTGELSSVSWDYYEDWCWKDKKKRK
jgi:CBS domain-containing protein